MSFHEDSFHQNPQEHYFSFRDYDIITKALENLQYDVRKGEHIEWGKKYLSDKKGQGMGIDRLDDLISYFKRMKREFRK